MCGHNKYSFALFICVALNLAGCGHVNTPSMVNTERPRLVSETAMAQLPLSDLSDGHLRKISEDYARYGSDKLQLALAYDPDSKTYGAMKAFEDLASIQSRLKKMGVHAISSDTVSVSGVEPTLMVSYDATKAIAPDGCRLMPGLKDGMTTREIGDYRFGCSIDSMLAQQIYRPSDLAGNDSMDPGDGRRNVNITEHYRNVRQDEAEGDLQRLQRADIGSQ